MTRRSRSAASDPRRQRKNPRVKTRGTKPGDPVARGRSVRLLTIRTARRWAFVLCVVSIGHIASTPLVRAQDINDSVTFEDLGFTNRLAVAARPAGMAGAYIAAGDDVHALVYNPAGLARVRRIDLSLGFQYNDDRVTNVFYGNPSRTTSSLMTLDALAAAYPVPTYRGSLVIAGGVYRVMSSQLDLLNRGDNSSTDTYDDYLLQQSGSVYSYNVGFGLDLGPEVSVGMNAFILDGTLGALTQSYYQLPAPFDDGDLESKWVVDDVEADLGGYGLTLGLQYHPHRLLHAGLVVATPIHLEHRGTAVTDTTWYFYNEEGSMDTEQSFVESDYTIPFRVDGGVSLTLPELTVSLDAGYSDWRQAQVYGSKLKDENLIAVFRRVFDVRVGVEYMVSVAPVRLRAGYARTPYALDYLQADRIAQNDIRKADIEADRQTFAAGLGILLDRVLTIDTSFEYQIGKRSIPTLADERSSKRVALTASYRF